MFSAGVGNNGKFNQNINNWNTSKVTSLASFAFNQTSFNQDISTKIVTVSGITYTAWSTSNVTTMLSSFATNLAPTFGTFNQNINNWNTSKVTSLANFMYNQPLFNQDISTKVVTVGGNSYVAWDTLNTTTMSFTFGGASGFTGQFNQNIGNWNTSKVTIMSGIFQNNSYFNQDISTKSVTVSGVTYTAWSTSNVTLMRYSFYNNLINPTSSFNQNIGSWNTAKVTDMTAMLYNRPNFNQNLGNWNVSLVTEFNGTGAAILDTFADYNGLSQPNYNSLLIGWASRPVLANKIINFGTANYTSGATASRLILTSPPNNWTIVDGGLI
jgi:surface protein